MNDCVYLEVSRNSETIAGLELGDILGSGPCNQGFRWTNTTGSTVFAVEFPYDPLCYNRFECEIRVRQLLSGDHVTAAATSALSFQAAYNRALSLIHPRIHPKQRWVEHLRFELRVIGDVPAPQSSIPTSIQNNIPEP